MNALILFLLGSTVVKYNVDNKKGRDTWHSVRIADSSRLLGPVLRGTQEQVLRIPNVCTDP